jgi:hypothetical protein
VAYKKKIKAYAIKRGALLTAIVLLIPTGYVFYRNAILKEAVYAANTKGSGYSEETVSVVRAKSDMKQGEGLDTSKVELVEVPASLVPKGAVRSLSKLDNMRLGREVAEKELLNVLDILPANASYEEGDRLIEHNFADGAVPAKVAEGSEIDIRLFVKGEEDRVVISKAVVVSRNGGLLAFYLNKEEQEFIKEAAAEGLLFAVEYLDSSQPASAVTYVPAYDKRKSKE